MAESNKKGVQDTTGSGGRGTGSPSTGATDPSSSKLGGSSPSTVGGLGTSGTATPPTSLGTSGAATGSTGTAASSARSAGSSDTRPAESRGNGEASAHGLIGQVKSSASETFQTVKSNTVAKLDEQKSTLSAGLMNVADNIRDLGTNLSSKDQPDPLTRIAADYSETAAEKLRTAADYFNTHDVNTMYRDVENIARRNPAYFVGGAFALGFIAARFLKSSSPSTGQTMSGRSIDNRSFDTGTMNTGTSPRSNQPRTSGAV